MSCCNNPKQVSSTYTDVCENCGYYYSYMTGEEGYDGSLIPTNDQEDEEL